MPLRTRETESSNIVHTCAYTVVGLSVTLGPVDVEKQTDVADCRDGADNRTLADDRKKSIVAKI